MGRLPDAWIAPPEIRGLREAIRHRSKLAALRCGLKAQVHAVLAKQGVRVAVSDLFDVGGQKLFDAFTFEIDILTKARVRSGTTVLVVEQGGSEGVSSAPLSWVRRDETCGWCEPGPAAPS